MIQIVNDYYESCGDASRLKCSLLEEYAVSCGFDIRAYDFRRNEQVRERINELRGLSLLHTKSVGVAYKNLDVDSFLNNAKNRESLKNSLIELDKSWQSIYHSYVLISKKNEEMSKNIQQKTIEIEAIALNSSKSAEKVSQLKSECKELIIQNRYLKKMIRQYLYPAIANEILKSEQVLEQIGTDISPEALEVLSEQSIPLSFTNATETDRVSISRETLLFNRMMKQTLGDDDDK